LKRLQYNNESTIFSQTKLQEDTDVISVALTFLTQIEKKSFSHVLCHFASDILPIFPFFFFGPTFYNHFNQ